MEAIPEQANHGRSRCAASGDGWGLWDAEIMAVSKKVLGWTDQVAVVRTALARRPPRTTRTRVTMPPSGRAEVAYHRAADAAMYGPGLDWDKDEPEFPEEDGPVFAVGGCALVDAAGWLTHQKALFLFGVLVADNDSEPHAHGTPKSLQGLDVRYATAQQQARFPARDHGDPGDLPRRSRRSRRSRRG